MNRSFVIENEKMFNNWKKSLITKQSNKRLLIKERYVDKGIPIYENFGNDESPTTVWTLFDIKDLDPSILDTFDAPILANLGISSEDILNDFDISNLDELYDIYPGCVFVTASYMSGYPCHGFRINAEDLIEIGKELKFWREFDDGLKINDSAYWDEFFQAVEPEALMRRYPQYFKKSQVMKKLI